MKKLDLNGVRAHLSVSEAKDLTTRPTAIFIGFPIRFYSRVCVKDETRNDSPN